MSLIKKALSSLKDGEFLMRVRHWLDYKKNHFFIKIRATLGLIKENYQFDEKVYREWHSLSALPGNAQLLCDPSFLNSIDQITRRKVFSELKDHRIQLLSFEPIDVNHSSDWNSDRRTFYRLTKEIPTSIVSKYMPIDWHRDFRYETSWPNDKLYFHSSYVSKGGADIKVPWELSRFQHIGGLYYGGEEGALEFLLQVADWIDQNPVYYGINWSSELIVAMRAISWIWALRLFEPYIDQYPNLKARIIDSIYTHRLYLEKNLAYHPGATDDHYLGDIVAILYISSAFPDFPESDHWCLFALQELVSEMNDQVLSDGFSHMMSSHYHRYVAELFSTAAAVSERIPFQRRMDFKNLNTRYFKSHPKLKAPADISLNYHSEGKLLPPLFYQKLEKMAEITASLIKPNGLTPQIGDNDSSRAHKLLPPLRFESRDHRHLLALIGGLVGNESLKKQGVEYAKEANLILSCIEEPSMIKVKEDDRTSQAILHPASRLVVLRNDVAHLTITCSPNGYFGKGGHGHNDKMSFELQVNGIDFIVDGGCPNYTGDPEVRNNFRSTKAHSTIVHKLLEQDDLSDDLFKLPEVRSNPSVQLFSDSIVRCSHNGFGIAVEREFDLSIEKLTIMDSIPNDILDDCCLAFNLSPDVQVKALDNGFYLNATESHRVKLNIQGMSGYVLEPGFFGVGYGQQVANSILKITLNSSKVVSTFQWLHS